MFQLDSPAMRFLSRVADLMVLNALFILTSLPFVTIGASLTALNYTAMQIVHDECESVTRSYFASFRSNVKQATLLWLIVLFLGLVMAAWWVALEFARLSVLVQLVLQIVLYVVAARLVLIAIYIFPYQATFEDSIRKVLRNSRLMSLRHLFSSLLVLVVLALPVVVTIFYPVVVMYGLLWFAFGFAGVAFVAGTVFSSVFARYMPPKPSPAPSPSEPDWPPTQ
jgi:uncharacterized membrane protein YesL